MTIKYAEGEWFAVPLRDGNRYAVGRIVRIAPKGRVLVAYFFNEVWAWIPQVADVQHLGPGDAVLKAECGDLGLVNGDWPVLGPAGDFEPNCWPMPAFAKRAALGSDFYRVEYPDGRPGTKPRETRISEQEAGTLPEYGMGGAGYVELKLTHVIGDSTT